MIIRSSISTHPPERTRHINWFIPGRRAHQEHQEERYRHINWSIPASQERYRHINWSIPVPCLPCSHRSAMDPSPYLFRSLERRRNSARDDIDLPKRTTASPRSLCGRLKSSPFSCSYNINQPILTCTSSSTERKLNSFTHP